MSEIMHLPCVGRVLAIIPARSGSKRLKNKCMRMCNGKPLLVWAIEAAKKSVLVSDIVVLTDGSDLAELAKEHGITVIDEPPELACDSCVDHPCDPGYYALQEFVENNPSRKPAVGVFLPPTSPLRTSQDIDKAIIQLVTHPTATALISGFVSPSPWWGHILGEDGIATQINPTKWGDSQSYPTTYIPDGAISACHKETLYKPYQIGEPGVK